MLHPNSYLLAHATHEQRLAKAVQKQRRRLLYAPRINRQLRLLLGVGNQLIALGRKFKAQTVATPPAEPAIG